MDDIPGLIFEKPSQNVNQTELKTAFKTIKRCFLKLSKRFEIEKFEVLVKEPKYATSQTSEYNTTLIVVPVKKGQYISSGTGKYYTQSLRVSIKQLERQLEKEHHILSSHHHKSLAENTYLVEHQIKKSKRKS